MTDDLMQKLETAVRLRKWGDVRDVLEQWPADATRDQAVERISPALESWSDEVREIPADVWDEVADGGELPPWWSLARHVKLEDANTLDPIDRAPQLTSIALVNPLVELDPLVQLKQLRHLEVSGSIDEWALLKKFDKLESFAAYEPPMVDLHPDTFPRTLRELTLNGSPLEDTSAFAPLRALKRLWLERNTELRDLRGLSKLHELSFLEISGCPVVDLAPLSALVQLETLSLHEMPELANLDPLGSLVQLRELRVGASRVTDVSALRKLVRLERLSLDDAAVTDLAPLGSLAALTFLSLQSLGALRDLAPITTLPRLADLLLGHLTALRDLARLARLPALTSLYLNTLPGVDAVQVTALRGLQRLNIEHTQISDPTRLDALGLQVLVIDRVRRA